jgi:hypothetical protein
MNHRLCITKVFNDAVAIYKNYWKSCLVIGTVIGAFWLVESKLSSHLSHLNSFTRYELLHSKHAVEFFNKITTHTQYHLTFPYSYQEYGIFIALLFLLLYTQLCTSRLFLALYTNRRIRFSDCLVSIETFARSLAAYLFLALMIIVFIMGSTLLFKLGDWFLLSLEHKLILLSIYSVFIALPFFLPFNLLCWSAVDGSRSVSQIIDHCISMGKGNKLRLLAICILLHLVSYIGQFCLLRLLYSPLMYFNIFTYSVFLAIVVIFPLKEAAWTSVYQQLK